MAHEQSETIERDGRWFNIYGRKTPKAGQDLPLMFPFEQPSYGTESEAVAAAKRRSAGTDPVTLRPRAAGSELEQQLKTYLRQPTRQPTAGASAGGSTLDQQLNSYLRGTFVTTPEAPSALGQLPGAIRDIATTGAREVGESVSRLPRLVTEGIPQAARVAGAGLEEAATRPTAGTRLAKAAPWLPIVPAAVDLFERFQGMWQALGRGVAELGPEQAKPLTEALATNLPFLGRAAIPGQARRMAARAVRPAPTVEPEPPAVQPQRALPPHPTELGPSPVDVAYPDRPEPPRPYEPPPEVIPGRRRLFEGEELAVPRGVEEPPRPVPSQYEVGARRAGIDVTEPAERPMTVLDQYGRPIMTPRRSSVPGEPPAEPEPWIPPEVRERERLRQPYTPPETPPPVTRPPAPPPAPPVPEALTLEPPVPGRTRGGATPAFQAERERWQKRLSEINAGNLNLSDPDEVYAYIRGVGRIRPTQDYPDIPWFFKNRQGRHFVEIVQEIADAQRKPVKAVENQIAGTLQRYQSLRAAKRAARAGTQEPPAGETAETPEQWEERARRDPEGAFPDWLRAVVPPIPLPDLPPEEQDSTKGRLYRALQIAGLAAPAIGMALNWRSRTRKGTLASYTSEDGRFIVEQVDPDTWHATDRTRPSEFPRKAAFPTFHEARKWAEGRLERDPRLPRPTPPTTPSSGAETPPPRFERTPMGDQALIPGTPGREIPRGPIGTERPQRPVEDLPLFGQERATQEARQRGLFEPQPERPGPEIPPERPADAAPARPEPGRPPSPPAEATTGAPEAPAATPVEEEVGRLPFPPVTDETGALNLGAMVDAWKKNYRRVRQAFPMEGEVRKVTPDSPALSALERFNSYTADWLDRFTKTPVYGALQKMTPAQLMDLEEQMVQGFQAGTVSRLGQGPGVPGPVQGYLRFRDRRIQNVEQAARQYFGLDPIPETSGPYLPRVTRKEARESVSLGGGRLGLGRDIQTTVRGHQQERVFETMRQGERAGTEYDDPRNAILLREWEGTKLDATHRLFRELEQKGVLFRDRAGAAAANAQVPNRTGGPWRVENAPGGTWWARTEEEAKLLEQNLTEPRRGTNLMSSFVHYANTFIRTPGLFNPLPHLTKNMSFKYLLARGPVGLGELEVKVAEYARGSNPTRLAEFQEAMPFSKSGRTASDVLQTELRESTVRDAIKAAGRVATSVSRKVSQPAVFQYGDPALRYALFDYYRRQGMGIYEAGNHAWTDLVRYGTRSVVTDEWKSIPMNFFVPWRFGSVAAVLKQAKNHPVRTALLVGGIEYLREMRYRHTGRWTHLPTDYTQKPIAHIVQERNPADLPAVIGSMAAFGPGGDFTASELRDLLGTFQTGSGRGLQDPDTWRRFRNMFWGFSQFYEVPSEVKKGLESGDPSHIANAFAALVLGEHSAIGDPTSQERHPPVGSEPRRLMRDLPEWFPGMQRAPEVRGAEEQQHRRRELRERQLERRVR